MGLLRRYVCLLVLASALYRNSTAAALEHPVTYYDVQGTVKDWSTKKPVPEAKVLVFLNGADRMNFGYNPEQTDYPNLPQTSQDGRFAAKAVFYWSPGVHPSRIEVIILAPGYITKRFQFDSSKFSVVERHVQGGGPEFGTLRVPDLEVMKYENLPK